MYNVTSIQDLKSTSVVNDPFLKVSSILPETGPLSHSPRDTSSSLSKHSGRRKNALFVPSPPQQTHFDYNDTVKQVTSPVEEKWESKIMNKSNTEGDEDFHRRIINLRNEEHWSDREYHAMALEPRAMTENERKKLNEKLSAIQKDERDLRYYPEGISEALAALRAEEDELKMAFKKLKYNEMTREVQRPASAPLKKASRREKWWELTSPQFTKELILNRKEMRHTSDFPSSRKYTAHTVPWKPQTGCPSSFDKSPHPMFGQSVLLRKQG